MPPTIALKFALYCLAIVGAPNYCIAIVGACNYCIAIVGASNYCIAIVGASNYCIAIVGAFNYCIAIVGASNYCIAIFGCCSNCIAFVCRVCSITYSWCNVATPMFNRTFDCQLINSLRSTFGWPLSAISIQSSICQRINSLKCRIRWLLSAISIQSSIFNTPISGQWPLVNYSHPRQVQKVRKSE